VVPGDDALCADCHPRPLAAGIGHARARGVVERAEVSRVEPFADVEDGVGIGAQRRRAADLHPAQLAVLDPGLRHHRDPRVPLEVADLLGAGVGPEDHRTVDHGEPHGLQVDAAVPVERADVHRARAAEQVGDLLAGHVDVGATHRGDEIRLRTARATWGRSPAAGAASPVPYLTVAVSCSPIRWVGHIPKASEETTAVPDHDVGPVAGIDEDVVDVLLIEDDPVVLEMYRFKLSLDGYRVSVATDGEAGVEQAIALLPDIIFLDIRLPRKDGFAVLDELRRRDDTRHIPVIILSNYGEKDLVERGLKLGAHEYLIKSDTTPGALSAGIERWVESEALRASG
jgi:CheY-like chemotaxis protein